jgi:hypothetical protein
MDDTPEIMDTELMGTWKLTEAFISNGGPQYWADVEDGEELVFLENQVFSSNRYMECTQGIFALTQDTLRLRYNCDSFVAPSENEEGFITYRLEFKGDHFIAAPTSGPICIEGCSYKYQRR